VSPRFNSHQGSLLQVSSELIYGIVPALLRAIAERIIPGIPQNIRILLVDQIEDNQVADPGPVNGDPARPSDPGITVTQKVVKGDRRREVAIAEHKSEI
jgi:ATP-binding cassette subfamily F protein 3